MADLPAVQDVRDHFERVGLPWSDDIPERVASILRPHPLLDLA